MESTDAGQQSPLFWLTIEAAVYCGIMKPLLSPGVATRNFGRPRWPEINLYIRLSEMFASSDMAIARASIGMAIGSPWKLPAEMIMSSSGKTFGLSVALLISFSITDST